MTTPTPGWLPDPTGRHEYRYWDGSQWCDDVSDGGNTSFDPIATATPQASGYDQQPASGYDQQAASGYGQPASAYGGSPYAPQSQDGQPRSSGPSTGLLVGLGVLLAVLVVGIVVVVTSGGDDDDSDAETAGNTATGDDDGGDVTTTADDGGSGSTVTDLIAEGVVASGNGVLTDEEGQCIAEGMVNELGEDRIIELGLDSSAATDPFSVLEPDEQTAVLQAILDCVPAETLAEIGATPGG
ncbi:MAG: DUF2510 domain-containing protein [Acidimicrobiales bacterium]